jgi:hypothetical protein
LTKAFSVLRSDGQFTTESIKKAEIAEVLFDHTGITVDVLVTKKMKHNAYVLFPLLDKNHPFFGDFIRQNASADLGVGLIRAMDIAPSGTIDVRNCRVSGLFSKLKSDIHMAWDILAGTKFPPEELASIFIHEVGHIFTYFFYLGTVVRSALITGAAVKSAMGIENAEERTKVLVEAQRTLGIEVPDIERVASADKRIRGKLIQSVFISAEATRMRVETGNNYYELRAAEQLADQFAVYHGCGPHLATALLKLNTYSDNPSTMSWPMHIMVEVCKVIMFAFGLVLMPLPMVAFLLLSNPMNKRYDDPAQRVRFIRQQIIDELKNSNLETARIEELKSELQVVSEVEDQLDDKMTMMEIFWTTIMPPGREAERQVIAQKRIEDLLNSELFVKAAEFKALGENQ